MKCRPVEVCQCGELVPEGQLNVIILRIEVGVVTAEANVCAGGTIGQTTLTQNAAVTVGPGIVDSIRIEPNVPHTIVATENTVLHEVSTPVS